MYATYGNMHCLTNSWFQSVEKVLIACVYDRLTLAAVKVNMGRKMMASLASGILVQTAANTAMMLPD